MSKFPSLMTRRVLACAMVFAPSLALGGDAEQCHILVAPPELAVLGKGGAAGDGHPRGASPHFGGHGQVIYGLDRHFLNHLPVFMTGERWRPHNFQVILEVEFLDEEARDTYLSDRLAHPDMLYTAVPQDFDQDDLAVRELGASVELAFPGTHIYRGHFEQAGHVRISHPTDLSLRQVVYFQEFNPEAEKLRTPHYLLHGVTGDVYAAKMISAPPDFVQILSVELDAGDAGFPSAFDEVLATGVYLHLPERADEPEARLRPGESLECSVDTGTRMPVASARVSVVAELYCEMGELAAVVPDTAFHDPAECP